MSDRAASVARLHPQPRTTWSWRQLLVWVGIVALLGVGVAVLLVLVSPPPAPFLPYLVYSECISLSVMAWVFVVRRFPWLARLDRPRGIALAMVAAIPLGYATGYALAATVLGHPVRIAWLDQGRRLGLLATLLAPSLFALVFWLRHRLLAESAARSEMQRLASETQLRLLRAQLEPHMLFNTLANLRVLVELEPARAQRMIDEFITYLRSTLAASRSEAATLQQEFAQLRAYLEIMALRMGARMSYSMVLPEALHQVSVPTMLLQPLVENAIKHGIEPQVGAGSVAVVARAVGDAVEISVIDSGLDLRPDGPTSTTASPSQGYGLAHVRERLQAVYGASASLTLLAHAPQGTCATVRIPR